MDMDKCPTISLGAMELRLFEAMRTKAGEIVSSAELIDAARCGSDKPDSVLRIMLSRIRARFRRLGLPDPILNTYGQGYKLDDFALKVPVEISAKSAARQRQLEREFS
jgi:DNA-binding winged helix-turn-helix (wHTH) protein